MLVIGFGTFYHQSIFLQLTNKIKIYNIFIWIYKYLAPYITNSRSNFWIYRTTWGDARSTIDLVCHVNQSAGSTILSKKHFKIQIIILNIKLGWNFATFLGILIRDFYENVKNLFQGQGQNCVFRYTNIKNMILWI